MVTATNCMDPAWMSTLIAIAHRMLKPFCRARMPKPRNTYPVITGTVSRKAVRKSLESMKKPRIGKNSGMLYVIRIQRGNVNCRSKKLP